MSADVSRLVERAAELRREFDEGFSRPSRTETSDRIELLAVRVGPDPHAIRIAEIAGLHADKRVVRVPSPLPELLGVVGLRSAIIPVYDLRLLLGYPAGPPLRWIVIAAASPVGLAFDHLDGHVVVSRDGIVAEPAGSPGGAHSREVVQTADGTRSPLIHVPSLVNEITGRARRAGTQKDR